MTDSQNEDKRIAENASRLAEWGVRYISEGRAVFLLSRDRVPYGNCALCWRNCLTNELRTSCTCLFCHGFYAATTDISILARMIFERPDSALAVRTGTPSDLVVLDVDVKDGAPGRKSLQIWCEQFPELRTTRIARTISGGWHLWLTHPGDRAKDGRVPCSASRLSPALDVRGDGGYVVVPPTQPNPPRRGYIWEDFNTPVIEMSDELIYVMQRRLELTEGKHRRGDGGSVPWPEREHPKVGQLLSTIRAADRGSRNAKLFWAACRAGEGIATYGWDTEEIRAGLIDAALAAGLSESEAGRTVRSALEQSGIRI